MFTFYSKLYLTVYTLREEDIFLDNKIPCIMKSFKKLCEAEFKIQELDAVVIKMAANKWLTANLLSVLLERP